MDIRFYDNIFQNSVVASNSPMAGLITILAPSATFIWLSMFLSAGASDVCQKLAGASIIADDGVYLGSIDPDTYSDDSIFNEYGKYGNKYKPKSIWNEYGKYGSQYKQYSPFHQYSRTPPTIYMKSNKTLKLTVNSYLGNTIDPNVVRGCFR